MGVDGLGLDSPGVAWMGLDWILREWLGHAMANVVNTSLLNHRRHSRSGTSEASELQLLVCAAIGKDRHV